MKLKIKKYYQLKFNFFKRIPQTIKVTNKTITVFNFNKTAVKINNFIINKILKTEI